MREAFIACLGQVDLTESVSLQVNPQAIFSNLKSSLDYAQVAVGSIVRDPLPSLQEVNFYDIHF